MKTSGPSFLTLTSISAHDGHQTVLSVPVAQIREIKESGFSDATVHPDLPISRGKAFVSMAGKDGAGYWTVETRAALVEQINGVTP